MKTLNSLLLASMAWLTLAGCGATDTPPVDATVVSKGDSNQTISGGFWWTYVDRAVGATPASAIVPNTGKLEPDNPTAKALGPSLAVNNGIEDDGTGNLAFHVTGQVRPSPKWTATLGSDGQSKDVADTYSYKDIYWDTPYGKVCKGGCQEVKYPAAGMGFGFQVQNVPIDLSQYLGVAFKIRNDGAKTSPTSLISVSLPMDITDVPDPSFNDAFGIPQADGSFLPYCTFPGSPLPAPATEIVGGTNKTCFKNFTTWNTPTDPTTNKAAQVPGVMTPNCLLWTDFTQPTNWGGKVIAPGATEPLPNVDPTRIIKMQFDAYKPTETETVPVPFDFWVDDVILLTCENWDTVCAGTTAVKPACTAAPAGG